MKHVLIVLVSLLVLTAYADETYFVAANCVVAKLNPLHYQSMAHNQKLTLFKLKKTLIPELIAAKDVAKCGGFKQVLPERFVRKNLSTFLQEEMFVPVAKKALPVAPMHYADEVNAAYKLFNRDNIWQNLTTLTALYDRHANSTTGVKAISQLQSILMEYAKDRRDVKIYTIATGSYRQPSLVLKIGQGNHNAVIVSAHIDTVQGFYSERPGADDDGSGSVSILEAARTILASNQTYQKPLYFIWYAAEEEGLVGSQYVVQEFEKQQITVDGVLHFDMTGYTGRNDPTIWLLRDYVEQEITDYVASLVKTYVKVGVSFTRCGYGCSDHASWTQEGIKAAAATESAFDESNPYIHSRADTMNKLSLSHMANFSKLAIAFAIEMAQPKNTRE